jgi:hypothetical protein
VLGGLVVVLLWVGFVAVSLVLGYHESTAGRDKADAARSMLPAGVDPLVQAVSTPGDQVAEESASQQLRDAAGDFSAASDRMSNPLLAPVRILPVVGRQVESVQILSSSAATVAGLGADAIDRSDDLLKQPKTTGPERVAVMQHLSELLHGDQRAVANLDLGPSDGLVGPLARARAEFADQLSTARDALNRAVPAVDGSIEFLQGPSRYLLLGANNAEMRDGSGMFLQAGVLTVDDGVVQVDQLQPTSDLMLPAGAVPLDGDFADRWGWLVPTQEWRNLNLTPRFDVSASLAAKMWAARGGGQVDGVMSIDTVAMKALVAAVGPIQVDGKQLDGDNVLKDLLIDQYADFQTDRDQRRDHLGQVLQEALAALDRGGWSTQDLVRQLASVAPGRHVLAWSPNGDEERAWAAMGIDGLVPPDAMQLGVSNRAGNKLDPYLAVQARATVGPAADGSGSTVNVQVTLTNNAPEGLPTYVAGPNPGSPVGEGVYLGFVSLTIPGAAGNGLIDGGLPTAVGADGPVRVLATQLGVARGTSSTVTFSFDLPHGMRSMPVLPSARDTPVAWQFAAGPDNHVSWSDDHPYTSVW